MSRVSSSTLSSPYARTSVMGIVLALLLGGCEYGTTPSEPPSATSTTTASPASGSSVPTPPPTSPAAYKPADAKGKAQNVPVPVMPELARENSKAGLEAFIGYWYATLSYAYETGDTKQLLPISSPACALCTSIREGLEAGWQEGRWIVGGRIRSAAVESQFNPATPTQVAIVQVIQEHIEIRLPDGSLYQEPTAATNTASRAAIQFGDKRWTMVDLGLIR